MMRNQLKKTNDNGTQNQNNIRHDDDGSEYSYRSDQKPQQEFNNLKNLNMQQQQYQQQLQQQKNQNSQSPQQQWINQDKQARKPQYGSQQQSQQQQHRQQQQQQQQQCFSQQPPLGDDKSEGDDSQNQLEHTFSEDSVTDNQSQTSLKTSNVPTFAQNNPKPSDKKILAIITLDVDEGKSGEIKVCEGDILTDLAREFCLKHQLDDDCIEFIASQCQNHLDARKKQRKIKQTNKQGTQNNAKNTQDVQQMNESKSGESPKFPMYQQTQNVKPNKSQQQQQAVGSFKYAQQQQQPAGFHSGFPGRSKNIAEQKIVEEDYEDQSLSLAGQSANASLPEEHYQPYPPQQIQTIHHTNHSSRSSTGRPQQRREGESEERKQQLMNEILLDDDEEDNNRFDGDNVDVEEQQFSVLNREQQRNNVQNLSQGQQQFQEKKQNVQQVNLRAKQGENDRGSQYNDEDDDESAQRRKQILSQVSQKLKQEEIKKQEDLKNNQINRQAATATTPTRVAQQQEKQNKKNIQPSINQIQQQQQQQIQLQQQQGRHHQQIQQKSNNQSQQQQQQQAYQAPQPRFKGGNLKDQLEAKKQQFFNSYQAERVPTLPVQEDQNSKELKEQDNQMRKSKSNNSFQLAQADRLDGRSDVKNLQGQQTGLPVKSAAKPASTTSQNVQNPQAIRNNPTNHPSEQNPSALVKNKSASMLNPSNSRQNTNPSSNAKAVPSSAYDKLYLQGLDLMEKKKRIYEENQAKLKQKEIAGVTFQPSISPQSRSLKLSEGVKVEDYLLLEGRKLKERKAIAVLIKSEENTQQCTFKPEISLVSQKLAEHMQQEQEQHINGSSSSQQSQQQSSSQQYSSIHERLYRQGEADKINKELWSNQQFGQIYPFSPDIGVNSRNQNQNTSDSVTQKEFVNKLVDERLLKERSTFTKQLDKEHFDLETGQPLYQPRINKDKIYQKVSERVDLQDKLLGEELRCRSVSPVNSSSNREGRKITPHRIRMLPWDELLRDDRQPWEYDVSRGKQAQSSQSSQLSKKSRCTTPKGCSSKGVDQDSGYVPLNKRGVSQNLNPQQEIEDIIAQFQRNHNNNNDADTKTIVMKSQSGHEDLTPVVKLQRFPQRQLSANISGSNQDKNTTMLQQTQGQNSSYVTTTRQTHPQQQQQQQQISNTSGLSGGYRSKSQINLQDQTTNNNNITTNNLTIGGMIPEKLNQTQMELSAISQLDNSRIVNDQKLSEKIDILFSQFDSDNDGKISSLSIDISSTDPEILQIIQHVLYEIDEKNLTLSKSQFTHFLASNQLLLPLKRYFAEKEGDLCDEDLTDYNVIRANNSYLNQTLENYNKNNNNNINASNFSGYKNPNNINSSNINKYL